MSDLRIGTTVPENMWTQSLPMDSCQSSSKTSAGFQTGGVCSPASDRVMDSNPKLNFPAPESSENSLSGDSGRVSSAAAGMRAVATTAGLGEGRQQQLTVDSKEKERLENIMAVAQ